MSRCLPSFLWIPAASNHPACGGMVGFGEKNDEGRCRWSFFYHPKYLVPGHDAYQATLGTPYPV